MDSRAIAAGAVVGVALVVLVTVLAVPAPVVLAVAFAPGLAAGALSRDASETWLDGAAAGFLTAPLVGLAYFALYGRVLLATSLPAANPVTPLTGGVTVFVALFLYGVLFFPAFTVPGALAAHFVAVYRSE